MCFFTIAQCLSPTPHSLASLTLSASLLICIFYFPVLALSHQQRTTHQYPQYPVRLEMKIFFGFENVSVSFACTAPSLSTVFRSFLVAVVTPFHSLFMKPHRRLGQRDGSTHILARAAMVKRDPPPEDDMLRAFRAWPLRNHEKAFQECPEVVEVSEMLARSLAVNWVWGLLALLACVGPPIPDDRVATAPPFETPSSSLCIILLHLGATNSSSDDSACESLALARDCLLPTRRA